MERTREQQEGSDPRSIGVGADIKRLRKDGSASVDELRDFVGRMHGKSPQEMMGLVNQSGLARGIAVSAGGFAAVLVVFTIIPYLWFGNASADEPTAKKGGQASAVVNAPANGDKGAAKKTGADAATGKPDPAALAKQLGIGEVEKADPNKNPLDSPKFDKLLDGLK
jgi:hypothetical protein